MNWTPLVGSSRAEAITPSGKSSIVDAIER